MKKYLLRKIVSDPNLFISFPIISGELIVKNNEIFNSERNGFDTYNKELIFKQLRPCIVDMGMKSILSSNLQDFYRWSKFCPKGEFFVITKKLKEIFDQYKIQMHALYKAELNYQKKVYADHFVMQLLEYPLRNMLDFENTLFENSKRRSKRLPPIKKEGITISSWEDILPTIKEKGWINFNIQKWAVKDLFWETDLMFLDRYGIVISEKLKSHLIESDITGVNIVEANFNFHETL